MERDRWVGLALIVMLALSLAGGARAQPPVPLGGSQPQAALGTAFTYQGRLMDGEVAAEGTYDLRFTLYDADGAVCSRDQIVEVVWPGTDGIGVSEQAIDALVRRLRDRLAEVDDHNYIVTVRGHGFRMDNNPQ